MDSVRFYHTSYLLRAVSPRRWLPLVLQEEMKENTDENMAERDMKVTCLLFLPAAVSRACVAVVCFDCEATLCRCECDCCGAAAPVAPVDAVLYVLGGRDMTTTASMATMTARTPSRPHGCWSFCAFDFLPSDFPLIDFDSVKFPLAIEC